jgi:hypothetical protein
MVTSNLSSNVLNFRASNVTGTRLLDLEVDGDVSVQRVARDLVELMQLPRDVSWVLREDRSASFLSEDQPIGSQLTPGAAVTVAPRTHLG